MLPEPLPTGTEMLPGFNVPLVALAAVQFKVAVHPTEMSPVETRLPVGAGNPAPDTVTSSAVVSRGSNVPTAVLELVIESSLS
jgi:hypothetical protein